MGKKPVIVNDVKRADSEALRNVVTLSEAIIISGKTRAPLINRIMAGDILARRSLTGGDWLIDLDSLLKFYPERTSTSWLIR